MTTKRTSCSEEAMTDHVGGGMNIEWQDGERARGGS
jgi:hypothetical protein